MFASLQPLQSISQWDATQIGCRKFAEIIDHPFIAAAFTLSEKGDIQATMIGGLGL
jgi:hypothetical protein